MVGGPSNLSAWPGAEDEEMPGAAHICCFRLGFPSSFVMMLLQLLPVRGGVAFKGYPGDKVPIYASASLYE